MIWSELGLLGADFIFIIWWHMKFVGIDFCILASSIICSTATAHKLLTCLKFRNCSIYLSPQPDIHSHMKVQGTSLAQPFQSQPCRPEWRPKKDPYSIHPASFWTGSWKFIPAQDRGQITPKKKPRTKIILHTKNIYRNTTLTSNTYRKNHLIAH